MNPKYLLSMLIFFIAVLGIYFYFVKSSGTLSESEELVSAANAIGYYLTPAHLSRSQFSAAYDNPKPSDFVSYLFSGMGAAEFPAVGGVMDEYERESLIMARQPVPPRDISYVSRFVDTLKNKQIVVKFDDSRGVVIAEGYSDPKMSAEFTKEWKLNKVIAAPGVDMMFRENKEYGVSYKSF